MPDRNDDFADEDRVELGLELMDSVGEPRLACVEVGDGRDRAQPRRFGDEVQALRRVEFLDEMYLQLERHFAATGFSEFSDDDRELALDMLGRHRQARQLH